MATLFQKVHPRLPVSNMPNSLAFYRDLFSLEAKDIMESDGFVILHRDTIGIQLLLQSNAKPIAPMTIWIDVRGVSALHDSKKDRFTIEWGPEDYSYGRREFCVGDPDRHQIIFSEPTANPRGAGTA